MSGAAPGDKRTQPRAQPGLQTRWAPTQQLDLVPAGYESHSTEPISLRAQKSCIPPSDGGFGLDSRSRARALPETQA